MTISPPNKKEKVWDFYRRYAVGSKLCPSCLLCGKQVLDQAEWSIQHSELPDIYICKSCVDAARAVPSATRESVLEEAAKVCEQMRPINPPTRAVQMQRETLDNAARLIRALKQTRYVKV